LEVVVVDEAAARLEVGLQVALQALDDTLGLWIGRLAEAPADPKLAAERGARVGRAASAGVQRALANNHQRLWQAAPSRDAAPQPGEKVGRLLGEDQRPRACAREPKRGDDHPAAARLAMADRYLPFGLPEIELQQLAAPINRPLERPPRWRIERPQLGHVVIDQRLAPSNPSSPMSSNTRIQGSLESSRNSRWISSLNGSSADAPTRRR
jgi:hypothetical protein